MLNKGIFIFIGIILCITKLYSEVWVYPGASETLKSKKYYVRIFQGDQVYESFVYSDKNSNTLSLGQLTDYNHWTNFSFDGEIIVEVTKLFGDPVRYCILRPRELRIKPEINGYVITFKLTKPCKILLEISEADADPVFIFADSPEEGVPSRDDPNVLWFNPGMHSIGPGYSIVNIDEVYISGGAYVTGSFISNSNQPLRISGRGILSGINLISNESDSRLIQISNIAHKNIIEGITLADIPGCGIYTISDIFIKNVKMFGWSFSSKGIFVGDSALIENCFFKVDNDIFTFNSSNIKINNCVIWQQSNGAPFQFTLNQTKNVYDCRVSNIDIIKIDIYEDSLWTSNKTIINCNNLNNGVVNNIVFENVRVEGNAHRLIGINTGAGGVFNNLTLRAFDIEGIIEQENYISAISGSVSNILFDNVVVNYSPLLSNTDANMVIRGNVTGLVYK